MKKCILNLVQEIPINNNIVTVTFDGESKSVSLLVSEFYNMIQAKFQETNRLPPAKGKVTEIGDQ